MNKSFIKYVLFIFFPICLFTLLPLYSIYYTEKEGTLKALKERQKAYISVQKKQIHTNISSLISDVLFISNWSGTQGFYSKKKTFLSFGEELLTYSKSHNFYDQIRLLDKTGQEVLRINNSSGAYLVLQEKLQNKKHRNYFQVTNQLERNQVYLSQLDLNIENKHIEEPFKPMLRICCPVFSENKERLGVVVLNYKAEKILTELKQFLYGDTYQELFLLNGDSYYLINPNSEKEWGFMLKHRNEDTFSNDFSEEYETVFSQRSGQFFSSKGLFTFETYYPLIESINRNFQVSNKNLLEYAKDYYWKTIYHVPQKQITHLTKDIAVKYGFIAIILLFIEFVISLIFAYIVNKNKQVQKSILVLEQKNSIMAMAITANHEINQPLMIIQGNFELLKMSLGEKNLSEKQNRFLEKIEIALQRITNILSKYSSNSSYKLDQYAEEQQMVVFDEKDDFLS